jgi:hypothetical protein
MSGGVPPPATPADPPPLSQAAKDVGQAGLEVGKSAWAVVTSFRSLVAADLSLSRSAFGLTLAYAGVAIALGASAWLLLMAVLVMILQGTGWVGWIGSLAIPAVLSLGGAGAFAWRASKVFTDTRLDATRRQLSRFSLAEDPADIERHPEKVP